MNLDNIRNPKWDNPEHTMIWCEAKFDEQADYIPISVHDEERIDHRIAVWDAATSAPAIAPYVPPVVVVEDVRSAALVQIDAHAGDTRARFITVAPGQELTYQEKSEEAADFVAAGYPADTTSYPFIEAEMAAYGKTSTQAADDILSRKSMWIAAGSEIERHRLSGKTQVAAAATAEEIDTIVADTIALLDAV